MFNEIESKFNTASYRQFVSQRYPNLTKSRPKDSHKSMFGTTCIVGGSKGMLGALQLAASAALYAGSGKVIAAFNQKTLPLALFPTQPELILDTVDSVCQRGHIQSWVVGCGMGQDELAKQILATIWHNECPQLVNDGGLSQLVLDADALHLLADNPKLFSRNKRENLVLTPHPGEAAHLLGTTVGKIQGNRSWAAKEIASRYHCWVVLKGHHTVISSERGFLHVNESGNAGLATAGSGDVLAGTIGGFLAQGIPIQEAVPAAVWLHGVAAELLAQSQRGPIGLTASELISAIRWLRNQLVVS